MLHYHLEWYIIGITGGGTTLNGKKTIKHLRLVSGLTIEEAANQVGLSREHLGRAEKKLETLRSLKTGTVLKLLNLYQVKIDDVIFFEDDTTENGTKEDLNE